MSTLSRRNFLLAGASVAALAGAPRMNTAKAAAGTLGLNLPNRGAAYEPWMSWSATAPRSTLSVVHSAILAANAHDTQPWKFRVSADRIDVHADLVRNLGAMDPFRREMHLSLGCALENAALTARSLGYAVQIKLAGGSLLQASTLAGSACAASMELATASAEVSPLLAAIPHRHTNRGPYQGDRPVPNETLELMRTLASGDAVRLIWITDSNARRDFAAATLTATESIVADAAMISDSDHWFRATDEEIDQHRDGPTLYCAGLSPLVLSFARLMPAISPRSAHQHWIDQTRDTQLATKPVIGLIAVRDLYDRQQALLAGRLWQRLHLQGTVMGLGMQPLNQLPECVDRELQLGKPANFGNALASLCGDPNCHATFAFRMGWPVRSAPASPRRSLSATLETAA